MLRKTLAPKERNQERSNFILKIKEEHMTKKTILTVTCCITAAFMFAKPAKRGPITVTQADGTETVIYQHGDEHFHWTTNVQGEWIEQDKDGRWQTVPALTEEQIAVRRAESRYTKSASKRRRKPAATSTASPTNIAEHGLVILVNFTDKQFTATHAEMDSMYNGQNYTRDYSYSDNYETYDIHAEGSARQYFKDASFGQYVPKFDVVGPVTVSKNVSYYGKNDYYDNDQRPWEMVYEACQLVDKEYEDIDFSIYDNDGDGVMDYVYVVYAGYGEADGGGANTIWPHSYWLTKQGYNLVIDGVTIDTYACSNEISYTSGQHDGIGTFCHEFSHVLGLPDFYATNNASHRTLGDWDIMDYGPYNNDGNNPPTYSGYERFFFGWATPRILTDPAVVIVHDLFSTNEVALVSETDAHNLVGNDPDPNQFYLIENRQQDNIWDKHLAGHGMMLTKVNYSYSKWSGNTPNNTANSLGVDIIEARRNTSSSINRATDLYPAGATSTTAIPDHPIYDIQEQNGVISFNFLNSNTNEGWEDIEENGDSVVAIYTITGQAMPVGTTLPSGLYIVKRAHSTEKIIVR